MNFLRIAFLALAAITCSVQATAGPFTVRLTALRKANAASSVVFLGGGGASTTTIYDGTNIASSAVSGTAPGATFGNDTDIATAYPGLTADISQAGSAVITSGQMQFRYGGNGDDSFTQSLSTADFKMTVKIGSGFTERLIWDRISRSTYSYFEPIAGDGAHFLLGGGLSNYVSWGRAIVTGDVVGIERAGNQLFFTLNGTAIGDPITQASQTHNNVVGIQKYSGGYFDDLSITSTPSSPLGLAGLAYDSEGYPTLTGTYQGSAPTSIDYRYQKLDGTASSAWQTASGTIGSGTFTVAGAGSLRTLTTLGARIQVRANDGSTPRTDLAIKTTTVPAVQAVAPFQKAVNSTDAHGYVYYNPLRGQRDPFRSASWRTDALGDGNAIILQPLLTAYGQNVAASDVGMGFDGVIHSYKTGSTYFRAFMPYWWDVGTYQLSNIPSGMTVTFSPNGTTASFNDTTKVLTIAQNYNENIAFTFSGTIPTAGINPAITRIGDANPSRRYADSRITALTSILGAGGWVRLMDENGANDNPFTRSWPSQRWTGSTSMGPSSYEDQVALYNAADLNVWYSINLLASDAEVTGIADYWARNFNNKVRWSVSNEVWNHDFRQWFDAILNGLRAGYYNTNGDAGTQTVIDGGDKFTLSGGTRVPNQGFASGAKVALNDGGFYLWQANRAITAGNSADAAGNTTNAAWTVLATPNDSLIAGRRWYSTRLKQVFTLVDAAYVAAGRSLTDRKRVVEWQAASGLPQMQEILSWGNLWQSYDVAATAPYFCNGVEYILCGDFSQNYTGWTATERAKVLTDLPAFKTAWFAIKQAAVNATIQVTVDYKQGLAKWLWDTKGVRPEDREFDFYESGDHTLLSNVPTDVRAGIAANWVDLQHDARQGAILNSYLTGIRDRIGGVNNLYTLGAVAPNSGENFHFGLQETETDIDTARIAVFKAFH